MPVSARDQLREVADHATEAQAEALLAAPALCRRALAFLEAVYVSPDDRAPEQRALVADLHDLLLSEEEPESC